MLLHGLTDAPQYASYWVMPVFYALLGLALARLRVQDPAARQPRPVAVAGLVTLVLLGAFVFVRSEILYSNLGSLYQTRADLALTPDDAVYQPTLGRAMDAYEQALDADAQAPVAHWRLGLMALDADDFDTAIQHLSLAHNVLSPHRGVQKALGYAYLWQGQIEPAAALLRPLPEIPQELETWAWWRDSQGQETLADYAQQLHELLQTGQ
jgi:tetratricopeptide (TPR) repeat protein